MSVVSFIKARGQGDSGLRRAIFESLDLAGYKFGKHIRSVVIKPNMCYYWDYTTGQTTDPKFVALLIEVIREQVSRDVNISIVESDASAMRCREAFRILGYERMARRSKVALVNLSQDQGREVGVKAGGCFFRFILPHTIEAADVRVNVPKIKYMVPTKITCALKNIYGCNPYPNKFRYHQRLNEAIVGLNKIMKFDLCVVDGNIVSGIQPRRLGLVMASTDPVATDVAAARIASVDPKSVGHIVLAAAEGLGNTSFLEKGTPSKYFERRYPRKKATSKAVELAFRLVQTVGLETRMGL